MMKRGQIEFHCIIWILNCYNVLAREWLIVYQIFPISSLYI